MASNLPRGVAVYDRPPSSRLNLRFLLIVLLFLAGAAGFYWHMH